MAAPRGIGETRSPALGITMARGLQRRFAEGLSGMRFTRTRVLPAAVSALLLALLFHQLPSGELRRLLGAASPAWLLAATGLYGAVNGLRAFRFAVLLPMLTVPARGYLPLAFATSLLNNVLPMRGGEVGFVVLMKARYHSSMADSTAALGLARLFDYLAVAALFVPLAGLSLAQLPRRTDWPVPGTPTAAVLWTVMGLLLLLGLVALSLPWLGNRGVAALRWLLARLNMRDSPLSLRLLSFGERTVTALVALRTGGTYLRLLGLSLILWLVLFAWLHAFVRALGYDVGYRLFIVGATFAVLSKAIPLPTLGGMGIAETGWTVGFTLAGWPPTAAIASGLAVTLLTLAVSAVFGLPSLWWLGLPRPEDTSLTPT